MATKTSKKAAKSAPKKVVNPKPKKAVRAEAIEDTSADVVLDPRAAVSLTTLERLPMRVTKFIVGMAMSNEARALMSTRGWSEAAAREGSRLLTEVLAPVPSPTERTKEEKGANADAKVAEAIRTLDALDEGHFGIAKTALLFNFVPQHDFVFHNLSASTGPASVTGWRTFLTRVNALRTGEGRDPSTREGDEKALALLAERGLPETELARIEALVRTAEGLDVDTQKTDPDIEKARIARLEKLWAWFAQWAAVARVEVKGRALRIRLGLAKRRSPGADDDDDDGEDPEPEPEEEEEAEDEEEEEEESDEDEETTKPKP